MAAVGAKPYRSPEGTYEMLLKSALEDTALSDHARSVLFFAAAKPERNRKGERWVLSETALARDMNRAPDRIRLALRELRKAGYLSTVTERDERGRVVRVTTSLNRETVAVQPKTAECITAGRALEGDLPPGGYLPPIESTVKSSEHGSVLSRRKNQRTTARFALRFAPCKRAGLPCGEQDQMTGHGY